MKDSHAFKDVCVKWLSRERNYEKWLYCGKDSPLISTEINGETKKHVNFMILFLQTQL